MKQKGFLINIRGMMMRKSKLIFVLLAIVMVFSTVAACDNGSKKTPAEVQAFVTAVDVIGEVTKDSKLNIDAAFLLHDGLSEEHKALDTVKTAKTTLDQKKAAYDAILSEGALKAEIDVFIAVINALPATDSLQLTNQADVIAARTAYTALSAAAKEQADVVAALAKIVAAEAKIAMLQAAATLQEKVAAYVTIVGELPLIDGVAITDKESVVAAKGAYDALEADVKAEADVISAYEKVTALLEKITQLEAEADIKATADLFIADVGKLSATITAADEAAINELLSRYNGLSDEVKNYAGVAAAKTTLDTAKTAVNAAILAAEAKTFTDKANAIGTVVLNEESLAKIVAAETAYTNLSAEAKALAEVIAANTVVTTSRTAYIALENKRAADAFIALSQDIGKVTLTEASLARILAAETAYNALSEGAVALTGVSAANEVVMAAHTAYDKLKLDDEIAKAKEKIDSFNMLTGFIPTVDLIKAGDLSYIVAAEKAFVALPNSVKEIESVTASKVIVDAARAKYEALKIAFVTDKDSKTIADFIAKANGATISADIKLENQTDLVAAERAFAILSANAKKDAAVITANDKVKAARTAFNAIPNLKTIPLPTEAEGGFSQLLLTGGKGVEIQFGNRMWSKLNEFYGGSWVGKGIVYLNIIKVGENNGNAYIGRMVLSNNQNIIQKADIEKILSESLVNDPFTLAGIDVRYRCSISVEDISGIYKNSNHRMYDNFSGWNGATAKITNAVAPVNVITGGENTFKPIAEINNTQDAVTFNLQEAAGKATIDKYSGLVTFDRSKIDAAFKFKINLMLGGSVVHTSEISVMLVLNAEEAFLVAVTAVTEPVTTASKAALDLADTAYTALNAESKLLENIIAAKTTLDKLKADYTAAVVAEGASYVASVGKIPAVSAINIFDENLIIAAETVYTALSADTKLLENVIAAKATQEAARAKYDELKAVANEDELSAVTYVMLVEGITLTAINDETLKKITDVEAAYTALSETAKAIASVGVAKTIMESIRVEYDAAVAEADEFIAQIKALPALDKIALTDSDVIVAAETAQEALSELANTKEGVDAAINKLSAVRKAYEAAVKADIAAAEAATEFIAKVATLPTVEDVSLTDSAAILAVEGVYNKLNDLAKAKEGVTEAKTTLDAVRAKYNQLKQAESDLDNSTAFKGLVDEIPSVDSITLIDLRAIKTAEDFYNSMSVGAKALAAEDYAIMHAARAKYDTLFNAATDAQKEAADFIMVINALPKVADIVLSDWLQISAAKTKYAALSEDTKAMQTVIDAKAILDAAEAKYNEFNKPALSINGIFGMTFNPGLLVFGSGGDPASQLRKQLPGLTTTQIKDKVTINLNVYNFNVTPVPNDPIIGIDITGNIFDNKPITLAMVGAELAKLLGTTDRVVSGRAYTFTISIACKDGTMLNSGYTGTFHPTPITF